MIRPVVRRPEALDGHGAGCRQGLRTRTELERKSVRKRVHGALLLFLQKVALYRCAELSGTHAVTYTPPWFMLQPLVIWTPCPSVCQFHLTQYILFQPFIMTSSTTLTKPPPLGTSIPERPHAVSVHLPKWDDVVDVALGKPRVKGILKGGYPRSFIHESIVAVHSAVLKKFGNETQVALVFPAREHVDACKTYLCTPPNGTQGISEDEVKTLNLEFDVQYGPEDGSALTTTRHPLFAVLLPAADAAKGQVFWRITGCGISSRFAYDLLQNLDSMTLAREMEDSRAFITSRPAEAVVRSRIASFLDRAPINPRSTYVQADDVFMFPAGMSAIYNCTKALKTWPGAQMVIFGFPYELTVKVQQDFSKACTFYGFGTTIELDQFEESLRVKSLKNPDEPPVQAVWCECASNPLLRTVDLDRIRRLADKYGFLVIIDDTIGSSANVDVMDIADIVITSLTKSFNGYADVLCGR